MFKLETTVPQGWDIHPIKLIVATKITDGPHETPELEETGVPFISAEAIKNDKIDFSLQRGYISEELHKRYSRKCKPQRKDIFIIKSGATTGNVAYVDVDFEFNIWSPLALIRCKEYLVYFKFLYYQLLSDIFRKQVELSWSFGTQENIGMRVIERLKVIIPKLSEQRRIVAYLDKTCAAIDAAIEKKQKQLETLDALRKAIIHKAVTRGLDDSVKLKDSGVEWFDKVPKHWEIDRLKDVVAANKDAIKVGPFGSDLLLDDMEDEGIKVYNQRTVIDRDFDAGIHFISPAKYAAMKAFTVYPHDLLITTRGTIGRCAIVSDTAQLGILHPCLMRVQTNKARLMPEYLSILIQDCGLVLRQLQMMSAATTIDVIYSDALKRTYLPLPPVKEQQTIIDFIDNKMAEFKRIIALIEGQIETLITYRKSLIHECVIGKRRITEAHLKEIEAHV